MEAIIKLDKETGLIVGRNYLSSSGFNCLEGYRKFGRLTIKEGVLKGTATNIMTNISVFDENNTLLIDVSFDKLTFYSREKARKVILNQLIKMLSDAAKAQGKLIDQNEVIELLDTQLKQIYFEDSYKSVLNWAEEIGIAIK